MDNHLDNARNVLIVCAMRTGVRRVAAMLAVVCGVVAGCSDPPKAAPLPSATPSTESPSAIATTPPDYEAEVRAAIATYFAALNAALRDPATKTDALAALIAPSCTCVQVVTVLREQGRGGYHFDYVETVTDVRVQQAGELGASVTYVVEQSAGSKRDRSNRVIATYPRSSDRISAHFRRQSGTWLLDRVDVLQ